MNNLETPAFADGMQREIYKLVRSFESCNERCLAQFGVTAAQGYALLAFPEHGSTSMNELSKALGLANSTMTRMVDTLAAKGLVYRRQDDGDRRVVRVAPTARGREMQHALETARREMLQQILDGIQEHDRPNVRRALEKLNAAVGRAIGGCCGI